MKVPVIELVEYNTIMSLLNFFIESFKDKKVHGKDIKIVQSYSDKHLSYVSPAMSIELLHRKNRSLGFGNFLFEEYNEFNIFEIEGALLEYRVQLNVYSNTRGEIHKWCSILDDILKNGENGISLNTYLDSGSIKQQNIGLIEYDYAKDVRNNNFSPNVVSSDFHTIYEVKMNVIQQYKIAYEYAELGDIIGNLK